MSLSGRKGTARQVGTAASMPPWWLDTRCSVGPMGPATCLPQAPAHLSWQAVLGSPGFSLPTHLRLGPLHWPSSRLVPVLEPQSTRVSPLTCCLLTAKSHAGPTHRTYVSCHPSLHFQVHSHQLGCCCPPEDMGQCPEPLLTPGGGVPLAPQRQGRCSTSYRAQEGPRAERLSPPRLPSGATSSTWAQMCLVTGPST